MKRIAAELHLATVQSARVQVHALTKAKYYGKDKHNNV
jgi:hypothetical protein